MSVYKLRFGTPEEFVPTKFAPKPACAVIEDTGDAAKLFDCTITKRGTKLRMPIDPSAGVYGFGLQLKSFQQRGLKKHIRPNADPVSNSGDTHAPVPFFATTAGYGIFVDTARYAEFYMGKSLNRGTSDTSAADGTVPGAETTGTDIFSALYAVKNSGGDTVMTVEIPYAQGVDVYYITGETVGEIVAQYNLLSGGGCMPAMWGLGNLYRCDMSFNEDQVLDMAGKFRKYDIPCDIIGLEPGWQSQTYSCSYVWDPGRFAHAQETVDRLRGMHFHVNLWEHAFIHPSSPLHDEMIPYSGDYLVWGGLVPDFAMDETRRRFSDYQKYLTKMGVDGFKLDECDGSDFTGGWTFPNCAVFPSGIEGDQYHSLFGLLYAKTQTETLGNTRTLSEVRNMGALAASYPFALYSDLYGHKDFLMGVVNAGFSGLLWSPEVRHAENKEDLLRRIQSVVFSPQSLINAFYLPEMPWEQHGCIEEARELFRVRMALLPYLYTMFWDYHTKGKAPVRALVCDYQNEKECWDLSSEYLFGDDMIVAPLTAPEKERDVWLPAGTWYDFFTGEKFEGGTHHVVTDGIPVYVKAGTLLPVAAPVNYVSPDTCFEITLRAYGDCKNSVCRLIEDDGVSADTEYRVITVTKNDHDVQSFRYRIAGVETIG